MSKAVQIVALRPFRPSFQLAPVQEGAMLGLPPGPELDSILANGLARRADEAPSESSAAGDVLKPASEPVSATPPEASAIGEEPVSTTPPAEPPRRGGLLGGIRRG